MDISRLIELVHDAPCLWEKGHDDYHDKHLKQATWESIAARMRTPMVKVKAKWENLRDTFKRKSNERVSETGRGLADKKKKWQWWESLSFLLPVVAPRR